MSNSNNEGLNERLARKKRVQRMKTGIIGFVLTWMLVCMLISVTLIVKVMSLQKQIDILTKNTIKSQQVEQQENQSSNEKNQTPDSTADANPKQKEATAADAEDTKDDGWRVYLTFDDGPSANTEKILNILDEYQIKATFFVTGREDEQSLARYKEITDRGNTIGMHSYSHKYDLIYDSLDAFTSDLTQIQDLILRATGQECRLYRFPGGSSNRVSNIEMSEFVRCLNERDITYFDWNVECGDASAQPCTTEELVQNVMNDVQKHSTSVVLLHDAENKQNTVEALPVIIEKLQAMGAQLLPISEDTPVVQHVSAQDVGE